MSSKKHSAIVELQSGSYEVIVSKGILEQCGSLISDLKIGNSCAIITDSNVAPLYAETVEQSLKKEGIKSELISVPAGESSKSLSNVENICRKMINAGHDRHVFVIALGGGVIGDLAGLVASIFYRGVPLVQIPTTVVSQVDSSVGGKTGINNKYGKNLIGSFYQPDLVISDIKLLSTLPKREIICGYAEILKSSLINNFKKGSFYKRALYFL